MNVLSKHGTDTPRIIDTHAHVFPDDLADRAVQGVCVSHGIVSYADGRVRTLCEQMQRFGVSRSLILGVATKPSQVHSINAFLTAAAAAHPELLPTGALYPGFKDNLQIIEKAKESGLVAFKMHAFFQSFRVNDRAMDDVYALLSEKGIPVIFHAGYEIKGDICEADPGDFVKLRARFKKLKMVLAHLGGNLMHDFVEAEIAGGDFYFDTAFVAHYIAMEQFVSIVNKHGAENVLFASDSPWGDIKEHIDLLERSPLKDAQKSLIFHKNAEFLFNM